MVTGGFTQNLQSKVFITQEQIVINLKSIFKIDCMQDDILEYV